MLPLIEAKRFHLNGELTEHDLWLKQKFERVQKSLAMAGCDNMDVLSNENL